MADLSLLAYTFTAGLVSFFSPCGFPMLPAYLAYYLPRGDGERVPTHRAIARGLAGGILAALGALVVLGSVGALAVALGAPFKERVSLLELFGGLVLIVMGILVLLGKGPSFKVPISPSRRRNALGLFAFGGLYAAVAASCVAPILISVVFLATSAPTTFEGFLLMGAYAAGLASLLVVVNVLIATSQERALRVLKRFLPHAEKVAGSLLVAVGIYLVWFWAGVEYGIYVPQLPVPQF